MKRDEMADLTAFLAVAEEGSFTRAAARLGMTQPALSQIIRRLEARMGIRLLLRTTRSLSPTEAGAQLLDTLAPALAGLDDTMAAISALRDKPAGTVRINAVEHAAEAYIYPALRVLLPNYPDIRVEVAVDYELVDIAAERFDAGVRLGEHVDKDMIAIRISPDMRQSVVASPAYFEHHPRPKTPQDLVSHTCINLWLSGARGHYVWEFSKGAREPNVRVDGQLAFNDIGLIRQAAIDGLGIANLPEPYVERQVAAGSLIRVIEDWCPPRPGYHLYYPSRRQPTPAFSLVVEALRYRS